MNMFKLGASKVSPLGIGTFGYGEGGMYSDQEEVTTILNSIKQGINYLVIYPTYAKGHILDLIAEVIKKSTIKPYLVYCAYPHPHKNIGDFLQMFRSFLKSANIKRVDTFMLSGQMEGSFGRDNSAELMRLVLREGLANNLGVCNLNIEQLEYYHGIFKQRIILHELCQNFEIRIFDDLGIISRNRELSIQTVCYQPLRRNRTTLRNWPLLVSLASKYGKTQNQIILKWLNQSNILSLVKVSSSLHLEENLNAFRFDIDSEDMIELNSFRPIWDIPKLNWLDFDSLDGIYVAKLSNIIDDYIK